MSPRRCAVLRVAALLLGASAFAQERPAEEALFGAPEPAPSADRDTEQLSGPALKSRFDDSTSTDDPLKVGGILYLRASSTLSEKNRFQDMSFSAPSLMDGYFDARPSERVRGMMRARLRYEPTLEPGAVTSFYSSLGLPGTSAQAVQNPSVVLDQLWVRFDIARAVFVTVGKQHVKWGASRFWNPSDFLATQVKDPLAMFDQRVGADMVKLHVPWESKGWNFYAIGLLNNPAPASTLGKLGGAVRAELVFRNTEVGIDAVALHGRPLRYGVDLSSALGPIDVHGELALRPGSDFQLWRPVGTLTKESALAGEFEPYQPSGLQPLASGGASYTFNYTDKNAATVAAEYFYNPVGSASPLMYPWLIYQGAFQPFYAGRHYAGLSLVAAGLPGALDKATVVVTELANVSDRSFLTRVDFLLSVLTYLQLEAYGSVHHGTRGGEFRFGLDLPPLQLPSGQTTPAVSFPAPVVDFGVGVRVSL